MALIQVSDLTFGYDGSHTLLYDHASFQIDTSWHLGFVGRNGRGKTTFLKLLMGEYAYAGSISAPCAFDYFPFAVPDWEQDTQTVLESVCPEAPQWRLSRELAALEVDEDILYRPWEKLSNGERTKALLCALFLKENRFLLIDEPTNHLDLHGRQVMSRYLKGKQGFILVSHDRAFLDGCVDHVLSINRADIQVQRGNYSTWAENRRRQDSFELAENEKLSREINRLKQSAREKAGWSDKVEATKYDTRNSGLRPDRGYVGHMSAKQMKRSKSIETRQTAAIEEKTKLLKNLELDQPLKLPCLTFRAQRLAELREVSVQFDGKAVFQPVTLDLQRGDRIAVTGRNGAGKTSLLRLLLGDNLNHTGTVSLASGLKISYLPQETGGLRGSLADFVEAEGLDRTLLLTILRKLDFARAQFELPMETFSAGQRKKVLLARSLCQPAHLYIWDEPLNYIDVLSRGQIEDVLLACQPTLLFVEHDQVFCNTIATGKLELLKPEKESAGAASGAPTKENTL